MCECCVLPICCIPKTNDVEKPQGYPEPPEKLYCPRCGEINKPTFRKTTKICACCFIPCCPMGELSTYLACSKCNFIVGKITGETCDKCHVTTASESKYCPSCGKARLSSAGIKSGKDKNKDKDDKTDGSSPNESDGNNSPKKEPRGRKIGEFKE